MPKEASHLTFGTRVFNDRAMKRYLSDDVYQALQATRARGHAFPSSIANAVAQSMKQWAMEQGATHYTHWFQPLNGTTAEKHESFLVPDEKGEPIMSFSGSALIQSEPDASSFPSGGLRSTFEARGYTAWDPTSDAFVRGHSLYIPTAFIAYTGEALDEKTPLLRSMEVLNTQTVRLLNLFGHQTQHVTPTVGAEQEYFLVDEAYYKKRPDLVSCGRTLLGSRPVRGQELEDYYYGAIRPRVRAFMREVDDVLWSLGVYAKTEHDEAAPGQHELACVFKVANIAADENQLVMEVLQEVATHHQLRCLLHEKPFRGVNGSGKHNNWAIANDQGMNLLNPGQTPADNTLFILMLSGILCAVDRHQGLLRASTASASNDHRLGALEAPPAIISVFLGDEITQILQAYESGTPYLDSADRLAVMLSQVLPHLQRDTTDRNRTSPFAFTGNKFEFRMPGSSQSVAFCNTVLNAAVAEAFMDFADALERSEDLGQDALALIAQTLKTHGRIIFNGDSYTDEWAREAQARGLKNYRTAPEALVELTSPTTKRLMYRLGVLSEKELEARCEINFHRYIETLKIEAYTLRSMVRTQIIPAVLQQSTNFAQRVSYSPSWADPLGRRYDDAAEAMIRAYEEFEDALHDIDHGSRYVNLAEQYRMKVLPRMEELRDHVDLLEKLTDRTLWPFPSYTDMLID